MRPGQFPAIPLWWEIQYVDRSVVRGTSPEEWAHAPSKDILTVRQVMDLTYKIGKETHHCTVRVAYTDYYWIGKDGLVDGGNALVVPPDLPDGAVKVGAWTTREEMLDAYNSILRDPTVEEVNVALN